MTTAITLPVFQLLARQPDPPHVARTVAQNNVANAYGALITYTVRQSRNGKSWWISASRDGLRMSNTLHTTIAAKAQAWIAAVKAGKVAIVEERTLTCAMGLGACSGEVTHIDDKGYVYCTGHGERRRCDGVRRCRKLRPAEIKKLTAGQAISYAPSAVVREHGKRCDKCTRILEPSGSCRAGCDNDCDADSAEGV